MELKQQTYCYCLLNNDYVEDNVNGSIVPCECFLERHAGLIELRLLCCVQRQTEEHGRFALVSTRTTT